MSVDGRRSLIEDSHNNRVVNRYRHLIVHFFHVSRKVAENLTERVAFKEPQRSPCDATEESIMNMNAGTKAELEEEKGSMHGEI
jgi:hypothetical protein